MKTFKEIMSNETTRVKNGERSALDLYAKLKEVEKHAQECLKIIKDDVISEAEKYGEKSFTDFGYEFEFRDGRRNFDFKNIDEWVKLKSELSVIEKRAKAAAEIDGAYVDEETGEVIEPCIVTYSKPSLVVKSKTQK